MISLENRQQKKKKRRKTRRKKKKKRLVLSIKNSAINSHFQSEKIAESDEKPTISSFFFSGDDDKAGSSDSDDSEGESVGPKKKRRSGESVTELDKEFVIFFCETKFYLSNFRQVQYSTTIMPGKNE